MLSQGERVGRPASIPGLGIKNSSLSSLSRRAKKVLHTGTHYFLPIFLFNPLGLAEALGGSDVS